MACHLLMRIRSLTRREWRDILRATVELARARFLIHRIDPRMLVSAQQAKHTDINTTMLDRVAWAVPAAASRVPWRSDCLVQALAAQNWLHAEGLQTQVHIGVARDGSFTAHAWLTCGDMVITGGEVARFVPFRLPA